MKTESSLEKSMRARLKQVRKDSHAIAVVLAELNPTDHKQHAEKLPYLRGTAASMLQAIAEYNAYHNALYTA